jgi:hypothetical protein
VEEGVILSILSAHCSLFYISVIGDVDGVERSWYILAKEKQTNDGTGPGSNSKLKFLPSRRIVIKEPEPESSFK